MRKGHKNKELKIAEFHKCALFPSCYSMDHTDTQKSDSGTKEWDADFAKSYNIGQWFQHPVVGRSPTGPEKLPAELQR